VGIFTICVPNCNQGGEGLIFSSERDGKTGAEEELASSAQQYYYY
jgi:hypothetical protein